MVVGHVSPGQPMRLAKYLAHAGVASRRAAEVMIGEGRVTVAGEIVLDPARDVDEQCVLTVDGRPVTGLEQPVVYLVNKPVGVVSTAHDTHGRPTVVSLVAGALAGTPPGAQHPEGHTQRRHGRQAAESRRLYPVGRLDADSSGLILLTNDGELAQRLTHPSFEVPKTYRVRVAGGQVGEKALAKLREGVRLEDGITAPAQVRRVERGVLELTIHEGRNRQVRRMCEAVGHPVVALERITFGRLKLGELAPGASRRLSEAELARLRGGPEDRKQPVKSVADPSKRRWPGRKP
ncbi:MAG TPA: pseudouridine synthase [Solirubrobacteraceae bacterium]|jgi:23S rRNA pseudouridine2605 synthase|nr:pseudouridine synthase [Solirubrobacteraceae bacterium]